MHTLSLTLAIVCALAAFGMVAWTQHRVAAMDAELRAMVGPADARSTARPQRSPTYPRGMT